MQSIIPLNLTWRAGNNSPAVGNAMTVPGANNQPMMNGPQNGEFLQSMIGQLDMEITDHCAQKIKEIDFSNIKDDNTVSVMIKNDILEIVRSYMDKYSSNLNGMPYSLSSAYERMHFNEMYKKDSYIDVEKRGIELSPYFVLNMIRYVESNIQIVNKNI